MAAKPHSHLSIGARRLTLVPHSTQATSDIVSDSQFELESLLARERLSRPRYQMADIEPETVALFKHFQAEQIVRHYFTLTTTLYLDLDKKLKADFDQLEMAYGTDQDLASQLLENFVKWIREQNRSQVNTPTALGLIDFILQGLTDLADIPTDSGIISCVPAIAPSRDLEAKQTLKEFILDELSDLDSRSSPFYQFSSDLNALKKALATIKDSYIKILRMLTHLSVPLLVVFLETLENSPKEILNDDLQLLVKMIRTSVSTALQNTNTDTQTYRDISIIQQQVTTIAITLRSILTPTLQTAIPIR